MKLSDYIIQNGDREVDSEKLDELLQIKRSKVWKPKEGELCWFLNSCGNIVQMYWENSKPDISRYERGYIKKTRQECEELDKYLTTKGALKRYAQEHNEGEFDWENKSCVKYFIIYNYVVAIVDIDCSRTRQGNEVYFTSRGTAKAAIDEIGEERIKQYLLYEG